MPGLLDQFRVDPASQPPARQPNGLLDAFSTTGEPERAAPVTLGQELGAGLEQGGNNLQTTFFGLVGMVGREFGLKTVEQRGREGVEMNQAEAAAFGPTVAAFSEVEDMDDFFKWAAGGIGTQIPQIGSLIASGGIGGAIAKKAAESSVKRAVATRLTRNLTLRGFTPEKAASVAARTLASPAAFRMVRDGINRGAKGGVFGFSAAQQTAETDIALTERGIDAGFTSLAAGITGGLLETLPVARLIDKGFPGLDTILAKGFIRDFAVGLGIQGALEGTTETAQEVIQLAALAYHDPSFDMANPANLTRLTDSFAAGALLGVVMGGSANAISAVPGAARKISERFKMPITELDIDTAPEPDTLDDFVPADNTFYEEVKSRINGVVQTALEPVLNSMSTEFQEGIDKIAANAPGLNDVVSDLAGPASEAQQEFTAGHQAIVDDAIRYAKEQAAFITSQAEGMTGPAKAAFVAEKIAEVKAELGRIAAELQARATKLSETTIAKMGDVQPFAERPEGLETETDYTFGQVEKRVNRDGLAIQHITRGEQAVPLANIGSAQKLVERLKERFPSVPDDAFNIRQNEDGKYLVTIEDSGQSESLRDDDTVAEGLEKARLSQRGNRDEADDRVRVKVQIKGRTGKTILDVQTLADYGKSLDGGDNETLAQGFAAMVGRLVTNNIISDKDAGALADAFEANFIEGQDKITLRQGNSRDEKKAKKAREKRDDQLTFDALPREAKKNARAAIEEKLKREGLEKGTPEYGKRYVALRKKALDNIDAQMDEVNSQPVQRSSDTSSVVHHQLFGTETRRAENDETSPTPLISRTNAVRSRLEDDPDGDIGDELAFVEDGDGRRVPTEAEQAADNPKPSAAQPPKKDDFTMSLFPEAERKAINKSVADQLKAEGLSAEPQADIETERQGILADVDRQEQLKEEHEAALASQPDMAPEARDDLVNKIREIDESLEKDADRLQELREQSSDVNRAKARDKFFKRFYELRSKAIANVQDQRDNPTAARRKKKANNPKPKKPVKSRATSGKRERPGIVSARKRLAFIDRKIAAKTANAAERREARKLRGDLGQPPIAVAKMSSKIEGDAQVQVHLPGAGAKVKAAVQGLADYLSTILKSKKTSVRIIDITRAEQMVQHGHPDGDVAQLLLDQDGPAVAYARDGVSYIIIDPTVEPGLLATAIAHEFGHIVHWDTWDSLTTAQQDLLWDAFVADVEAGNRGTGRVLRHSGEAAPGTTRRADKNLFEFREWMADNFVSWMNDRKEPTTALEKFFETIGKKLDAMWAFMRANLDRFSTTGGANSVYSEFIDAVAAGIRTHDPTGRNRFFLNENAKGRALVTILSGGQDVNPLKPGPAPDAEPGVPKGVTRSEWSAVTDRVENDYPTIAKRIKLFTTWMSNAYDAVLAPATSVMRTIGARIDAANELVDMFGRGAHGLAKKEGQRNYHQRVRQMQAVFQNKFLAIVEGMTAAQKDALLKRLRNADGNKDAKPRSPQERAVRKLFDEMHTYLEQSGLPVGKVVNYYPRTYSRDKILAAQEAIIKHLMSKGMNRKNARAFFNSLISFEADESGSLSNVEADEFSMQSPGFRAMRSRTIQDPFFEQFLEDNIEGSMFNYINAAVKRAEYNAFLGEKFEGPSGTRSDTLTKNQWNPHANIERIMQEADAQGATEEDLKRMHNFVEAQLGRYGRDSLSEGQRKLIAGVIAYQNLRTLLFTVFASLPDVIGPAIRSGDMRLAWKASMRGIHDAATGGNQLDEMARAFGVISDAANQHILMEYVDNHHMPPTLRKWNDTFFKWTKLNWWTDTTRKMALAVGIDSIKDQARKAQYGDTQKIRDRAIQFLAELGLTADSVDAWVIGGEKAWGGLGYEQESANDQKISEALIQFVDESIMRPNASQRPILASHPAFAILYHLKGFLYAFHEVILKRLAHNFDIADTPAQTLAAVAPALLIMALTALGLELRELVTQKDYTARMDGWDYVWTVTERSGLLGISQLGFDFESAGARGQAELVALAGPSIGQAADLISKPFSQTIPKAIPVVSQLPWARNALRDATPL